MKLLENKIPPPVLAVLFGLAMWGVSFVTPAVEIGSMVSFIISLVVLVLGVFFCLAGVFSFRKAKTTVNPLNPESATSLVSSGIYKVSRNPMYVGFALILLAWALYLASPVAVVGVLGFVFIINRLQIEPEERALLKLFGSEFDDYQSIVRRWL